MEISKNEENKKVFNNILFVDNTATHKNKFIEIALKYRYSILIFFITSIILACRFISMWHMPDVFSDEQIILKHINSIILTKHDIYGAYMPLYTHVGEGFATFPYLYPMVAFLSFIGFSEIKARFIQQILTVMACVLTASGVKIWTNNCKLFWIVLWVGLTLPWGFVQANRIWDPSFTPVYFGIYFFFFSLLMCSSQKDSIKTYCVAVLCFSSLVLLATVYPPSRIPAVGMWIYSLIWAYKEQKIHSKHIIVVFVFSTLFSLPLAINLLNPDFNQRASHLFIFFRQDYPILKQIYVFISGFIKLFNPIFLFFTGDRIYRHSLPIFGMLGTISIIPIITLLLQKTYSPLIKYIFFTIVMTYFSVALTYDYQPHGLRSCQVWLPYTILISYGWLVFLNKTKNKIFWYIMMGIAFGCYFTAFLAINHGIF